MGNFRERKEIRTKHYETYIKGWKLRTCSACGGSGVYDHIDSPNCSTCGGTGKERYKPKILTGYPVHTWINCIDAYEDPPAEQQWDNCPCCGLRPKVWTFDNGRSTACGCWDNTYKHHSIMAESIMSVYKRTGRTQEYDSDGLRKNWNHWCKTGKILFAKPNGLW
jgi:hypothetical protein